ncbi:hypothetical protein, partial [Streptacidiphilus neutrinimicus]|uniref:hypothetical protein n=1 Tax=Streptacidiphilus neutrinimicus TaxID=105420 RepID=UPI0005A73B3C
PTGAASRAAAPSPPAAASAAAAHPTTSAAARPAAPLAAAQLPDEAKALWKPIGAPTSRPAAHRIGLDECADTTGATAWLQQGWASAANTPAIQDTFTYANPADAARALQQADNGLQNCQTPLRALQTQHGLRPDATVARTAAGTDATAWQYQWNAVPGMSAPGEQIHHVYLVQYGDELTVLQYTDLASAGQTESATPTGDQTVLATLAAHLRTAR